MPTTITGTTIVTTTITGSIARLTGGTQEFVTPTSGTAAYLGARAWVNFNGTGAIAIRGSSNVSSITDNGTGNYRVNFTTAMADSNYGLSVTGEHDSGTGLDWALIDGDLQATSPSSSSVTVNILGSNQSFRDTRFCFVTVFS